MLRINHLVFCGIPEISNIKWTFKIVHALFSKKTFANGQVDELSLKVPNRKSGNMMLLFRRNGKALFVTVGGADWYETWAKAKNLETATGLPVAEEAARYKPRLEE